MRERSPYPESEFACRYREEEAVRWLEKTEAMASKIRQAKETAARNWKSLAAIGLLGLSLATGYLETPASANASQTPPARSVSVNPPARDQDFLTGNPPPPDSSPAGYVLPAGSRFFFPGLIRFWGENEYVCAYASKYWFRADLAGGYDGDMMRVLLTSRSDYVPFEDMEACTFAPYSLVDTKLYLAPQTEVATATLASLAVSHPEMTVTGTTTGNPTFLEGRGRVGETLAMTSTWNLYNTANIGAGDMFAVLSHPWNNRVFITPTYPSLAGGNELIVPVDVANRSLFQVAVNMTYSLGLENGERITRTQIISLNTVTGIYPYIASDLARTVFTVPITFSGTVSHRLEASSSPPVPVFTSIIGPAETPIAAYQTYLPLVLKPGRGGGN